MLVNTLNDRYRIEKEQTERALKERHDQEQQRLQKEQKEKQKVETKQVIATPAKQALSSPYSVNQPQKAVEKAIIKNEIIKKEEV